MPLSAHHWEPCSVLELSDHIHRQSILGQLVLQGHLCHLARVDSVIQRLLLPWMIQEFLLCLVRCKHKQLHAPFLVPQDDVSRGCLAAMGVCGYALLGGFGMHGLDLIIAWTGAGMCQFVAPIIPICCSFSSCLTPLSKPCWITHAGNAPP